jgi:DNA-binding XRE family transcriptional regulator
MREMRCAPGLVPDRPIVAARVKAERRRLGLSTETAAERLEIATATYRYHERGGDPKLSTLLRLKAAGYDLRAVAPELFAEVA